MIPRGLPGEGNIMIFDNGGTAGYGLPNPMAPHGFENCKRDYSRVIEFDPITFEMKWQYTPKEAGFIIPLNSSRFYSPFISSAQRLPNGNTLITEGGGGRLFEVTRDYEIVWEYISPYYGNGVYRGMSKYNGTKFNAVYRAYRVPYEYCPQAGIPTEVPSSQLTTPISVCQVRLQEALRKLPSSKGPTIWIKLIPITTSACQRMNRKKKLCVLSKRTSNAYLGWQQWLLPPH